MLNWLAMKTLPYLKQITYAVIIVAFPFIFSASNGLKSVIVQPKAQKNYSFPINNPEETMNMLKTTVDSLKNSGNALTQNN
jgi:hypothetical protein